MDEYSLMPRTNISTMMSDEDRIHIVYIYMYKMVEYILQCFHTGNFVNLEWPVCRQQKFQKFQKFQKLYIFNYKYSDKLVLIQAK